MIDDQEFEGFDDLDSVSKSPERVSGDETPIPDELAKEEIKHLYGMMKQLDAEVTNRGEAHKDGLSIFFYEGKKQIIVSSKAVFKDTEVGTGDVSFNIYRPGWNSENNIYSKMLLEGGPGYVLKLGLHMDTQTEKEAKDGMPKGHVRTNLIIGADGRSGLFVDLPSGTKTDRHNVLDGKSSWPGAVTVETPLTPTKAEYIGMALSHLMNRVKAENGDSGDHSLAQPRK